MYSRCPQGCGQSNSNEYGNLTMLSPFRRLIKKIHPEGIPFPGTVFYNAVSGTEIFQNNYDLIVSDILTYTSRGSLLDIGTGPGRLLIKLFQQSPDLNITGLDISSSMVSRAQKNINEAGVSKFIAIKQGSASNLPFDDNSFDIVISTGSLHHWKEPVAGLNEVFRVLKDGGYALIYDIVSDTPASILKESARKYGKFRMFMLWLHAFEEPFYNCDAYEQLAAQTRFKKGKNRFVGVLCCLTMKKGNSLEL